MTTRPHFAALLLTLAACGTTGPTPGPDAGPSGVPCCACYRDGAELDCTPAQDLACELAPADGCVCVVDGAVRECPGGGG